MLDHIYHHSDFRSDVGIDVLLEMWMLVVLHVLANVSWLLATYATVVADLALQPYQP